MVQDGGDGVRVITLICKPTPAANDFKDIHSDGRFKQELRNMVTGAKTGDYCKHCKVQ